MADEKKPEFGAIIPQMYARLAAERFKQERAWVDQLKFASWGEPSPKRSRWCMFKTRLKIRLWRYRLRLARWIAGDEWPEEW